MAGIMQAAGALVVEPGLAQTEAVQAGAPRPNEVQVGAPQSAVEQSKVRCERIAVLDRSITALIAERAALLVAERDSAVWKTSGFPSFEAWRGPGFPRWF